MFEEPKRKVVIRESAIESALCKAAKKRFMIPYKFTSPGRVGVPDRLIVAPFGDHGFVEVKAPGKLPTPAQLREHDVLRQMGHKVFVLDNFNDIESVLDAIQPPSLPG